MDGRDNRRAGSDGGALRSVVSYLEMRAPPVPGPPAPPRPGLELVRLEQPSVPFYRFLYDTIGEPWLWIDRRRIDDAGLEAIIRDPRVEVHVLYGGGEPLGYAELDFRLPGEVEIVYCGLMPHAIGGGLGRYLLGQALARAWAAGPERVWLHTCTQDHPGALSFYERAGFVKTHEVEEWVEVPPRRGG